MTQITRRRRGSRAARPARSRPPCGRRPRAAPSARAGSRRPRRAGEHDVAGRERDELGDRRDQRRDVEDEPARVRGLHALAVELERDVERVRVADLVGRDQERAERGRAGPGLARQPLVRPVLVVAHRDVVGERVAGRPRRGLRRSRRTRRPITNASSASKSTASDSGGSTHRLPGADQRLGELGEQRRVVGDVVDALLDVRLVVEPDAQHLARAAGHRPQRDVGERHALAAQRRVGEHLGRRVAPELGDAVERDARRRRRRAPRTAARRRRSSRSGSRRRPQRDVERAGQVVALGLDRAHERLLDGADRVVLQVRVAGEEDLRDQCLVARAR